MLPSCVLIGVVLLMEAVEDGEIVISGCRVEDLEMFYGVRGGERVGQGGGQLPVGVKEVVVGTDHEDGSCGTDRHSGRVMKASGIFVL